jgi:glycosyltransferase involved in cell wall biosynthesis
MMQSGISFIPQIIRTFAAMQIGFDAKRAYHNQTGLGHYSRTLIHSLAEYYPAHEYFLFNPKPSSLFSFNEKNVHEVGPSSFVHKLFSSAWRSSWIKKDLQKHKIDLYHGLSHEIPVGIQQTKIKSVVTIHDLIHERHPEQYNKLDVQIYNRKFRYACKYADHVIAISEQTKRDIIEFYKTPEEKITVCYQSCNPAFSQTITEDEKARVKKLYQLPEEFFLYVGSIIERKNLLNVCKAVNLIKHELNIPLVVIGNGKEYKQQVKTFIVENNLQNQIIFLSESESAKSSQSFQSASDFPAIYQSAIAMIYPSFFEGFGIPVLEALCSGLPVVTSNVSCLPEAGGDAAYYVNPSSPEEIAAGMKKIFSDNSFAESMKQKGLQHAQNFTQQKCAGAVMNVYKKLF